MVLWDKKGVEKGREAEAKFKKWLDEHKIYYFYIEQNLGTFPIMFGKDKLKRPDFMILLPNVGFILVDVKHRSITGKYNDIAIDAPDLKKYALFQSKFHVPVWYTFSNETLDYKTWFWIPISKILELNPPKYTSSISKEPYFPVKINEFVEVKNIESLAKIFSKSF
jgi:hypothetical protein